MAAECGRPWRSRCAYSSAARAMPTLCAAMPMRPLSSVDRRSVAFTFGADALSSGTSMFSNESAQVRRPSGRVSPRSARREAGVDFSTTKAERPFGRPTDPSPRTRPCCQVLPLRDELLGAVDDISIALLHRPGSKVRGIRPGLRFGQARRSRRLPGRHWRSQRSFWAS